MNYDAWKTTPPDNYGPEVDGDEYEVDLSRGNCTVMVAGIVGDADAVVTWTEDAAEYPVGSAITLTQGEVDGIRDEMVQRALDDDERRRHDAAEHRADMRGDR